MAKRGRRAAPREEFEDLSADHVGEKVDRWRRLLTPMSEVVAKPPTWIIRDLLVPGFNLIAGPPKVFKTRLFLHMIAALLEQRPVAGGTNGRRAATKKGSVAYFAAEQDPGTVKHIYEKDVLKRPMRKGVVSWDFVIPKNAWHWQIDEVTHPYNLVEFINDWQPTVVCLDPLVYFHSLDENDPRMVRPLVPIRDAVLKYKGALVVIHHAKKKQGNELKGPQDLADFDKVRGTSALFGMADSATLLTRLSGGAVNVASIFKTYPQTSWTWRNPEK